MYALAAVHAAKRIGSPYFCICGSVNTFGFSPNEKKLSPKDVHGALSELMMIRLNGGCVWFGPRTDPIPYPMGMPVVETIWSLCSWSLFSHTSFI